MREMSYDVFCTNMQERLQKYYGTKGTIKLQCVQKINGVLLRGITIMKEGCNIMPTVYLEGFYEKYERGTPLESILKEFIEEYERAGIKEDFSIAFFEEYENVRPRLGVKLINYDMNWQLLQEVPHFCYLDLAVVCYCMVENATIGKGSILIRKEHVSMWKLDEKTVLRDAVQNMQKRMPAQLINMAEVLREMYEDPAELVADRLPMYVLTNKEKMFGAASLLYEGMLDRIAETLGGDFYLLPSSLHEVILLTAKKGTDENYLSQMVNEINKEQLDREEILSNHAYLYSHLTKEFSSLPLIPYKKNSCNKYHEQKRNALGE